MVGPLDWKEQTAEPRREQCNPEGVRPEKNVDILEEAPQVKKVGAGTLVVGLRDSRVDTQEEGHRETRAGAAQAGNQVGDCLDSMDGTLVVAHREMRVDNREVGHQERKVDNQVEACRDWMECDRCLVGPLQTPTSSTACRRKRKGTERKLESRVSVMAMRLLN